jgi:multidrug efflux pump
MSRFFIDRPIFAWVIAIVIMLAGGLAILKLPVSQYPAIAPPQIAINAMYPGASAKTVEDTVTQVIEQKMNGIDALRYMSSSSDSSGAVSINLTFDAGTDPNIAQVQVQNKLQLAMPLLPQKVQQQGIQVVKSTRNYLMIVALVDDSGRLSRYDISDYLAANVQEPVSRVTGVGEVTLFGSQYAMRIWLDPNRLSSFGLTPADVRNAVQAQNAQVSAGQLGGAPFAPGQQITASITGQTLLKSPEEFDRILLRTNADGSVVRLKDVARSEIGTENYGFESYLNGKPASGIAIRLAAGANALQTADAVKAKVDELSRYFPAGVKAIYPVDTTPFVRVSIEEVVKTLVEAIALVFIVMYLFLQNFRATLIPSIAVPVVLLGTFGVLAAFGFSINTLTMFAMVLAIGLLVDDAIVVVENVERIMTTEGLPPKEATRKSMDQITGALIGIALVLSAVFVPMAFFGGSTGVIYRQFSLTIVSSMVLSVLVALILTPALCATILKPVAKGHEVGEGGWFAGFFHWFNRVFDAGRGRYQGTVGHFTTHRGRVMASYGAILVLLAFLFWRMPTAFLPDEDQGAIMAMVQLPAGATLDRTQAVLNQVDRHFREEQKEAVDTVLTVAGFSFGGRGQNMGLAFVKLKDWDERTRPDLRVKAVAGKAMKAFSRIRDAMVFAFPPPAVAELGNATGFDLQLQDRGGLGHTRLMEARNQFLGMASQDKRLMAVRPNGQDDTPEYRLEIDKERLGALGLSVGEVNDAISTSWGSAYVGDFLDKGRVKKVYLQSDAPFRMNPEDLERWFVRNRDGAMVPFSAFATTDWGYGSPRLERYNGIPSVELLGQPSPGLSTGEAMKAVEEIAKKLPQGIGFEWTGISYEERMTGAQAPYLYAISLVVVFLSLAALYESWAVPFSVMLVVPLGVIGALLAATMRGMSNDVYFQVGLLTTVGLSAKNAILIVEFAEEQLHKGVGLFEATLEGCRLRLRPILMTSLAFILGVLPLVKTKGAGAGAQNAIGTGVMGGMISATFLAILFVPVFFIVVRTFFPVKREEGAPEGGTGPGNTPASGPSAENA